MCVRSAEKTINIAGKMILALQEIQASYDQRGP